MSLDIHINAAEFEDLEAVVELDRATALLPHWTATEYAAAVQKTGAEAATGIDRRLFVAKSADTLAGFIVVKIARLAEEVLAEVESIAVAAGLQRQGTGKALCAEAIEWARTLGAIEMELEVRSRNDAAIALYARLGFFAHSARRGYYRDPDDDALLMRLVLR